MSANSVVPARHCENAFLEKVLEKEDRTRRAVPTGDDPSLWQVLAGRGRGGRRQPQTTIPDDAMETAPVATTGTATNATAATSSSTSSGPNGTKTHMPPSESTKRGLDEQGRDEIGKKVRVTTKRRWAPRTGGRTWMTPRARSPSTAWMPTTSSMRDSMG